MSAEEKHPKDERPRDEPTEEMQAAPPESVPRDPAAGVEPMAEVPGGPQVDVPAAQGNHRGDDDDHGGDGGADR